MLNNNQDDYIKLLSSNNLLSNMFHYAQYLKENFVKKSDHSTEIGVVSH